MVLETERLILRRFTIDDLEPVFNNCWSKPEVWQWTNYKPMKTTEDVVKTAEMFTGMAGRIFPAKQIQLGNPAESIRRCHWQVLRHAPGGSA